MNRIDPWKLTDLNGPYTRGWYKYSQDVLPQSQRQVGDEIGHHAASTLQVSIGFFNLANCQKTTSMANPITGERRTLRNPGMNMLLECWGQNHAHVILTAGANNLPQDKDRQKQQYGLTGAYSKESSLACHANVGDSGPVEKLWGGGGQTQHPRIQQPSLQLFSAISRRTRVGEVGNRSRDLD